MKIEVYFYPELYALVISLLFARSTDCSKLTRCKPVGYDDLPSVYFVEINV